MQYKEIITGLEPVTVDEVKEYLKVQYTKEDSLIEAQISAARSMIEKMLNISVVEKTITLFDDQEVCSPYLLPFPQHGVVNSVSVNGVDCDTYEVTGLTQLSVSFDGTLISNTYNGIRSIEVEYTTNGYCDPKIKDAIKGEIADLYEQRGSFYEGALTQLSYSTMLKLQPFINV